MTRMDGIDSIDAGRKLHRGTMLENLDNWEVVAETTMEGKQFKMEEQIRRTPIGLILCCVASLPYHNRPSAMSSYVRI